MNQHVLTGKIKGLREFTDGKQISHLSARHPGVEMLDRHCKVPWATPAEVAAYQIAEEDLTDDTQLGAGTWCLTAPVVGEG